MRRNKRPVKEVISDLVTSFNCITVSGDYGEEICIYETLYHIDKLDAFNRLIRIHEGMCTGLHPDELDLTGDYLYIGNIPVRSEYDCTRSLCGQYVTAFSVPYSDNIFLSILKS